LSFAGRAQLSGKLPQRLIILMFLILNENNKNFYFHGKIDEKDCSFKIDTGSDISIINEKFVFGKKEETFFLVSDTLLGREFL
jgi:hypothetical protein